MAQSGITQVSDLNGDGKGDFLWRNAATGEYIAWLMDGIGVMRSTNLRNDPAWKIVTTADFDGDGRADIVWYNASTGQTFLWIMNGTSVSSQTLLLTDPLWKVIEAADFNGDGRADLVWYNASTGETALSLMNGASVSNWVLTTEPGSQVVATGDFNGDGMADLLWYNAATGQTSLWLMNGTSPINAAAFVTDPAWKVAAIPDFNGDRMADILWYDAATGETVVWLMNGTVTLDRATLRIDLSWKPLATGDLNADGRADLIWYNQVAGETSAWLMDGTSIAESHSLLVDPDWKINAIADISGDGMSDLLWYNATTREAYVWLMNGTDAPSGAMLPADPTWVLECVKSSSWTPVLACGDALSNGPAGSVPSAQNQAPVVNAGFDQSITLPAGVILAGTASDDGLPTGSTLTVSWSKVSGPGAVAFVNATSLNATATFATAGTYTLRLTASDSALSAADDVVVSVNAASAVNKAPVVNAGPDQVITLPAGALLAGTVTDDGLPNGSTLTRTWSKVSGPGTVVFVNATSLSATATFATAGTYVLRLTASDSALSAADDVVFVVNAATSTTNQAPVVNAGPDQSITLPAGANLSGTISDDGLPAGNSLTNSWNVSSGPGIVTFGNVSSPNTTATFSQAGTYLLKLASSDGAFTTVDDVIITVNPASSTNQAPDVDTGTNQTVTPAVGDALSGRTFYIDFASGSDSNNGTSKSTPWKHVKGMQGCTASCSSITLGAGDQIVFKGGVTWTSSFPWVLSGGTAAANVVYTTDRSWFDGGSFTQPVFDDGHANPGGVGMANATSIGYITLNDLNWINCGTAQVANSNKCLVFTNTNDITITNSTFATESWISIYFVFISPGSYSNFTWTGNDFSRTSGAVWFASAQSNTTMHNVNYNSNTFHDFTSQIGGGVHGDGALHFFSSPSGDSSQFLDGITFCNNRFYGDFRRSYGTDGAMTGFFFAEGSISGTVCNNDMSYSPSQSNMFDGIIVVRGYSNSHPSVLGIYNNSIASIGANAISAAIHMDTIGAGSSIAIKNNIISAPQYCMYLEDAGTVAAVTSDYNLLNCSSGQLAVAGPVFKSYSQWQALGWDTHSVMGSDPLWVAAPGNENLRAGSPAITAGTNLTNLGIPIINSDAVGNVRPSTGSWRQGAFQ